MVGMAWVGPRVARILMNRAERRPGSADQNWCRPVFLAPGTRIRGAAFVSDNFHRLNSLVAGAKYSLAAELPIRRAYEISRKIRGMSLLYRQILSSCGGEYLTRLIAQFRFSFEDPIT